MAPYLLLIFLSITSILANMAGPKRNLGPRNYDRDAENAYKAAFEVISKKEARRRRLINLALLIALLANLLLLVWIFEYN